MKTVFMFPGQGVQYFQMGRQLFDAHPVFRDWMLRLDHTAQAVLGRSIIGAIYAGGRSETFNGTLLTHPAIFMVEVAMAQCLISEGIEPDMTLGASLGTYPALVTAGAIDVFDAMEAVAKQAQIFEKTCPKGIMLAVFASLAVATSAWLAARSELVASDLSTHFVIALPEYHLADVEAALGRRGILSQQLPVEFAYHSRWIDEARPSFDALTRRITRSELDLPLACSAHATVLSALPDDFHWRVVRQPIQLRRTLETVESQGPCRFIDVGPSGSLATLAKHVLPPTSASTVHAVLTPYGRDLSNLDALKGRRH